MHLFSIALLIGVYSYLIFSLGLAGLLFVEVILITTFSFILLVFIFRKKIFPEHKKNFQKERLSRTLLLIIFAQILVNLIGVAGPEIAFDSLWYHLTFPKLYIADHAIFHVPGSLLYYSTMPKLLEMLYIPMLLLGNEVGAKFVHFLFGILCTVAIYLMSKQYMGKRYALLAAALFYSNLVVAWESITAYIDLGRAFFEFLAFWAYLLWVKTREKKWLIESAALIGLAISAKLLAVGSLIIFICLLIYDAKIHRTSLWLTLKRIAYFSAISMLVPLPWFVFSYVHTGNPIYPIFESIFPISLHTNLVSLHEMITAFWKLFVTGDDPISPIYIILLPIVYLVLRKLKQPFIFMLIYSIVSLVVWYITPRTGGGRFFLPYLPVLTVLCIEAFRVSNFSVQMRNVLVIMFTIVIGTSVVYRTIANSKFVPYLLGNETKQEFLTKHLNFSFGDFYDVDDYFAKNIKPTDTVLLYGFHNLYYVNFRFLHESFVQKGNSFQYIATQHKTLPKRFHYWNLIYENPITGVKLYSSGGQTWIY